MKLVTYSPAGVRSVADVDFSSTLGIIRGGEPALQALALRAPVDAVALAGVKLHARSGSRTDHAVCGVLKHSLNGQTAGPQGGLQ